MQFKAILVHHVQDVFFFPLCFAFLFLMKGVGPPILLKLTGSKKFPFVWVGNFFLLIKWMQLFDEFCFYYGHMGLYSGCTSQGLKSVREEGGNNSHQAVL